MTSWRFARLRGPAAVLLSLVCGLALVDLAVSGAVGWDTFGGGEQSQTFSRLELASAKALALREAGRTGTPIGLVVGMSTADWGIDLRQLERADDLRWAKVTGEFSSFTNLLEIVRRFEQSGVKPNRTLLCIHYGMLLGSRQHEETRAGRARQLIERTRQSKSSSDVARAVTLSWLGNNRAPATNELELELGHLRARALGWFGQPASVVYPVVSDPFGDTPYKHAPMHPSVRTRHVNQSRERWKLALADTSQVDQAEQVAALKEVVARLAHGPGFAVVLMPEHSELRSVVPESFARVLLDKALQAAHPGSSLAVIDLRAALADDFFADELHATAEGRPELTKIMARAIAGMPRDP